MENKYKEILSQIITPSYLFDVDAFKDRCFEIKEIVGENVDLCYSMKANPFLIEFLPDCISRVEVCSPGEMCICEHYNIPSKMVFYSGVNKNTEDVADAFRYGVKDFTVESYKHLSIINNLGKANDTVIPIYIRISSETQFGMDINDVKKIIHDRSSYPYVIIAGIHFFSGTQKKKTDQIIKELSEIEEFIINTKETYDHEIKEVEYGTGLFIDYFNNYDQKYYDLKQISYSLNSLASITKLTIEMGRYFAAPCGYYITRIDDIKNNDGENFIIVDGGMNQLVYDGQLKAMRKPAITHIDCSGSIVSRNNQKKYTICGSLCTTSDVIVRDYALSEPQIGDYLIFHKTGAYTFMEGMSTFLSREMPQIWALKSGELIMLRDRIYTHQFNRRRDG